MTKVLYFPPSYVSSQPVLLDLTDTAAAALVSSGAGAYPVPMPLDRRPGVVTPSPVPTPAPSPTPTPTPGDGTQTAYLGQVASRSYVPNTKSNASSQAQSRTVHVASQTMTNAPQVAYAAWYVASSGLETPVGADLTYKVGIEYPEGTITLLTWAGSTTKVATPGGDTGLSDAGIALPTPIPSGAKFWLRPYVTGAGNDIVSYVPASGNVKDTANGEATVFGTAVTDQSATGAIIDNGTVATVAPLCIVAMTTKATFLANGDSRTAGSGGAPNARGDTGEIAQSIGAGGYAYINAGIGGDRATYQAKNYQRRAALGQYCSHIIVATGINDLQSGGRAGTDLQLRAARNTICQIFAGKPIIGTTLPPVTSGAYADAAGQTVDAGTAAIQSFNAWMRSVPAPYAAVCDIASAVEDTANPGKWKSNLTSDGLHQNVGGYAAVVSAGVINPTTLAALGRVAQPWTPMQISSALLQFFEADNADSLSSDLSLWNSTIGATGLSQATAAKRPVLANPANMAGKAVVAFDGVDDALIGGAASKAITRNRSAITIALVGYGSAGSGNAFLVNYTIGTGNTTRAGIYLPTTGFVSSAARRLDADAGINTPSTSTTAAGDPFILIVTFNPATGTGELRKNGVVETTFAYAASGNFSNTDSNAVTYGAGTETSNYANCAMGAALIGGRAFTESEKQLVEGAWAAKYGLQGLLPANHPFKSGPPIV